MPQWILTVFSRWRPILVDAVTLELPRVLRDRRLRWTLAVGGLLIGLTWTAFHALGCSLYVERCGRSIFTYLAHRYREFTDEQHSPFVFLITVGLLWYLRRDLAALPRSPSLAALPLVALALLLHWIGVRGQAPRISVTAFILFLWAVVWLLWGWPIAAKTAFPIFFLAFALPVSFLNDQVAFPLRMIVTKVAADIAHLFGINVIRQGTQMFDPTGKFQYDVAPACSGIRSLLALTMLTGVYGYVTQPTALRKAILFISAIPLAVLGNLARVTMVIFAGALFGQEAGKLVHDWGWILTWSVTIFGMRAIAHVLMVPLASRVERWTERLSSHKPAWA